VEERDVFGEMLGGVALGIHGDEEGLNGLGGGAEPIEREPDRLEIGRADVRAIVKPK
jgi:hypothetical protein